MCVYSLKHAASLVVANKRAGSCSNGRAIKKVPMISQQQCLSWFKLYSEGEGGEEVCPEGMERFCCDLGVEPEDVSIALVNLDAHTYRGMPIACGFAS